MHDQHAASPSEPELLFGATVMWQVYCGQPISDESHARFVELYGWLGSTFLLVRAVRSLEVQLAAGNCLLSHVPALRQHLAAVAWQHVDQEIARIRERLPLIGASHGPLLGSLPQPSRPQLFKLLKEQRRLTTGTHLAAAAAGKRFALSKPLHRRMVAAEGRRATMNPAQAPSQE